MAFEQLPVVPPTADTEVLNGAEPVSPDDWPATLIFLTEGGGCTSTLVGSKVILTAAHCIGNGETGTIVAGGEEVSVTCDHHPVYPVKSADFALCLITNGEITSIPFEVVGTALAHARMDDPVTLSGYGCLEDGGRDRSFGMLHVGTATVTETPVTDNLHTITGGGAALCFGDSGGPAYFDAGDGERLIIGVNSQGDVSMKSALATTATAQFVDWAFEWAKRNDARICGLHVGTRGCRS